MAASQKEQSDLMSPDVMHLKKEQNDLCGLCLGICLFFFSSFLFVSLVGFFVFVFEMVSLQLLGLFCN